MNKKNSIYRFTSFESFVNIVQNKKLAFVNHELWEDPYEGFIFKALKSPEGRLKIQQISQKLFSQDLISIMMLSNFNNCIHGQSWSRCEESDALWRIYSFNNQAIRIEVDFENINKLLDVICGDIIYKDFKTLEEEILDLIENNGKTVDLKKILLRKRTAFQHEEEIRLLTKINLNFLPQNNRTPQEIEMVEKGLEALRKDNQITEQEYQNGLKDLYDKKVIPKVVHISFEHIQGFIKTVMVHPQSSDWFCETVKEFCKRNNLKYIGKSKLYTLTV